MNDNLFVLYIFIIIIIFFVTFYYCYNIENFSSYCEEIEVQSNGGICKPYYGIAPAQAINPYKKHDQNTGIVITNDAERYRKNKEAVKNYCINDDRCKGYFMNTNTNSDNEGYLCKPEWDGSSFSNRITGENIDFKLYKCKNRIDDYEFKENTSKTWQYNNQDKVQKTPIYSYTGYIDLTAGCSLISGGPGKPFGANQGHAYMSCSSKIKLKNLLQSYRLIDFDDNILNNSISYNSTHPHLTMTGDTHHILASGKFYIGGAHAYRYVACHDGYAYANGDLTIFLHRTVIIDYYNQNPKPTEPFDVFKHLSLNDYDKLNIHFHQKDGLTKYIFKSSKQNGEFTIDLLRSWDPRFTYGYMNSLDCQYRDYSKELEWTFVPMIT